MKTKNFLFTAIIMVIFTACTTENFNYAPNVELLYSPVRLNDTTSLLLKKVSANNIKIDSMKIGDSLTVKVHITDLMYHLKSVKFVTDADISTGFVLPDNNDFLSKYTKTSDFLTGNLQYKNSLKTDDIEILYIAKKSSKTGHLTIFVETSNPDSINYQDSLRISTPVKFLK